jgi:hypothetical protein
MYDTNNCEDAMRQLLVVVLTMLPVGFACAADDPQAGAARPPVLRKDEPSDSIMVTLPGALAKPANVPSPPAAAAPALESPVPEPPSKPLVPIGLSRRAFLPPDLQKEVALFCQQLIGQWTEEDAEQLLGKPLRSRPSFDEKKVVNGKIYAFADPSGRYRELELDFEQAAGTLRTVFAYPKWMTWQDCRRRWNGEVSETDASQGRMFYSYLNRRLDVLVDSKGRVISLGLY